MVNFWFGARWFGIRIGIHLSNKPFHKGTSRNPYHRAPNHQLLYITISWKVPMQRSVGAKFHPKSHQADDGRNHVLVSPASKNLHRFFWRRVRTSSCRKSCFFKIFQKRRHKNGNCFSAIFGKEYPKIEPYNVQLLYLLRWTVFLKGTFRGSSHREPQQVALYVYLEEHPT